MNKALFEGCGVALITPFRNGQVDETAFSAHLDRLIAAGVDALLPCGTTGEPSCLSEEEWCKVISITVKKANGKVPVIAGTGTNNTLHVIERAKKAHDLGADAQLCVTPYYNKTTQQGLIAHYYQIADHSALPVYVYNVPSRTGMDISLDTYRVLCAHENIIAVKDAGGNVKKSVGISNACGNNVSLYSGDDQLVAPLRAIGYRGVVSVTANLIPETVVKLSHANLTEAGKIQSQLYMLNELLFCETSPAPVKHALNKLGLCENELRLPLVPLSAANAVLLENEMRSLKIL